MKLSEIAYKEEIASKEGDEITIEQYHQSLLKEYKRVLEMLRNHPQIVKDHQQESAIPQKELDDQAWSNFLSQLKEKIETFESNSVKEVLKAYESSTYKGESLKEWIKQVSTKVDEFDFAGALSFLEDVTKEKDGK